MDTAAAEQEGGDEPAPAAAIFTTINERPSGGEITKPKGLTKC